jgi:hypothetical protein
VESPALKNSSSKGLNTLLFLLFVLFLGVFKFSYHEFWKDEWQAWFVATDTPTLQSLWKLLPVEGHPALWFLILRFAHNLSSLFAPSLLPEYLIQSVHFLLTVAAAWFFFLRFRIHYLLKIGFALSYFFFFEYGVINRGYILVILFLFWTIPYLEKPKQHISALAGLLFLLTQTEIYGVFASVAVGLVVLWKVYKEENKLFTQAQVIVCASVLSGLALFVCSVFSPGISEHDQAEAGAGIGKAFVSLYSNTLAIFIDPPLSGAVTAFSVLLSLLIGTAIGLVLWKDKVWLISFLLYSLLFLLFCAFVYHGGPRQWGLHFIFLLFVLNFVEPRTMDFKQRLAFIILLLLIIPGQLIYSLKIVGREKQYLFSNSIEAGRYIRKNIPQDVPIVGINKAFCTPVIGYSGHKFFSLPDKQLFSYSIFREKMYLPSEQEIRNFHMEKGGGEMYLLSYKPLPEEMSRSLDLKMEFNKRNIRGENYYLYQVRDAMSPGVK